VGGPYANATTSGDPPVRVGLCQRWRRKATNTWPAALTGTRPQARCLTPARRSGARVVILPAFLAARQSPHLAGRPPGAPTPTRPPGRGGTPPLPLEARLDAVAAVVLDGLSYRRAGRMVGISTTEVGDSLDLLLGPVAALGFCQPDGTFVTTLGDVRERLAEMVHAGEAVCVDGLATRVQRAAALDKVGNGRQAE
jgi:hypothetical protein